MSDRPETVCRVCGVAVVVKSGGQAFHTEALPEGAEYHSPVPVRDAELPEPEDPPTLALRQVEALERIAAVGEAMLEIARARPPH